MDIQKLIYVNSNYNSDIARTKDMKEIYHRIRKAYKEQKGYNTIFKREQP